MEVDLADLVREEGARPRATNLLGNASRHATAAVTVTLTTDGTTARLVADDDGPGVPVEHRERLFDRFVRSDAGGPGETEGPGWALPS